MKKLISRNTLTNSVLVLVFLIAGCSSLPEPPPDPILDNLDSYEAFSLSEWSAIVNDLDALAQYNYSTIVVEGYVSRFCEVDNDMKWVILSSHSTHCTFKDEQIYYWDHLEEGMKIRFVGTLNLLSINPEDNYDPILQDCVFVW